MDFSLIKRKQTASIAPLRFVGFAWVTISWGAYAGAATMILYSGFYFLSQCEFKFLFVKQEKPVVEGARYLLLAILPICLWFTWWAAMGQLDGYTHPRDIDWEISTSQADTLAIEIPPAMPGLASWAVAR